MPSIVQELSRIKDIQGKILMKTCSSCKQSLPLDNFSLYKKGSDKRQGTCKPCSVSRKRAITQRHRNLVGRWKKIKGCCMCGFKAEHHCQLDLDHINPLTKHPSLRGHSYEPAWSLPRIKQELAKCVVICKNCHSEKTILGEEHMRYNEWTGG